MVLVEPLHDIQSFFCGKAKTAVRIPLKLCEVIQTRRISFFGSLVHFLNFQRVTVYSLHKVVDAVFGKRTVAATFGILPGPGDTACCAGDTVIFFWFKFSDFFFSLGNHGKCRCLHTAAGKLGVVLAGQCSCGVDADEPVCLGA